MYYHVRRHELKDTTMSRHSVLIGNHNAFLYESYVDGSKNAVLTVQVVFSKALKELIHLTFFSNEFTCIN